MLDSIVPPRLNDAIEAVVKRDKTIDARPGPDYERLFTLAKNEAADLEVSVKPVYEDFKDKAYKKGRADDSDIVQKKTSTGPNSSREFVGKKHGDTLYTGRLYEVVDGKVSYSIYGTFNLEHEGGEEVFKAHGNCRVQFEDYKESHCVDHRFMKMQNGKPEVERLEFSVLTDGSKQFQWMVGAWPSHNHPTFFINEKGTLRVSREKTPGVFKVFCVRQSKDLVSIEMYYVDKMNRLFEKYEQIKYDSFGRYYHRNRGQGTCVLNENIRYEGKLGPRFEITGKGRMITLFPPKEVAGVFEDGLIKEGTIKAEDWQYQGHIDNGQPNGRGKKVFINKDWAEGQFKDGELVGQGRFFSNCCDSLFEGEFHKGKKHGKGVEVFKNGDRYEGDFKENQFSGKGVMYFQNGDVYEGGFEEGVFHGQGVLKTNEATIDTKWTHGKLGEQNEEHIRTCCAGHSSPVSRKTKRV